MSRNFLDHIGEIEDGRIARMTTYPLNEVLLTVLVGLLCRKFVWSPIVEGALQLTGAQLAC
jgi:hypothetical protein